MNDLDQKFIELVPDLQGEAKIVLGSYALHLYINPAAEFCVFTFDNAGSIGPFEARDGWGFRIFQNKAYSVVSVMSLRASWYREDEFSYILDLLRGSCLLKSFTKRISYGGSMGGFAAAAFAKLLGVQKTILLNPITTHCSEIAPWETRYPLLDDDWSEGVRCAVEGIRECEEIFVVVDNLFHLDFQHANRFRKQGIPTTLIRVPGVGHGIPIHLSQMNLLKDLVISIVENRFDRMDFSKKIRCRRQYERYWQWMLSEENRHLNEVRRTKLTRLNQAILSV